MHDSLIYAFAKIKVNHAALRDSISDQTNRDQLEALCENAVAGATTAAALERCQDARPGREPNQI